MIFNGEFSKNRDSGNTSQGNEDERKYDEGNVGAHNHRCTGWRVDVVRDLSRIAQDVLLNLARHDCDFGLNSSKRLIGVSKSPIDFRVPNEWMKESRQKE